MPSRLLIVDDDAALLQSLPDTIALRLPESVIDTATCGTEALEKIRITDYDAIVTDIKMPGLDGLSLMRAIQQIRPRTPTLLITGHAEHDLAVKALQHGAYAFLDKPLDREFFVAWLKRAIDLRQTIRELEDSEQRFKALAENAFEAIALSEKGRVLDVNEAFVAMFGYAREEAIGMAPMDFHSLEYQSLVKEMNFSGIETRYEAICRRKDGTTFAAEIRGRSVPYHGRMIRVTALHRLEAGSDYITKFGKNSISLTESARCVADQGLPTE
jgi:PAS domain S-box-containing protein